ncbi:hypothetical protein [Paenibacillus cellulositrophicus]|uniref:hypothetical protein n=1 Tax=Paenibacillus cellulositrophicus TaxID=562959 RepID=UPI001266F606|nr:hypothetical protein [Paenibacillus cellulositrophicus]
MEAQAIKEAEKLEGQDLVEVTLRISAKGAYRVYDEFPDSMITANSDGQNITHQSEIRLLNVS